MFRSRLALPSQLPLMFEEPADGGAAAADAAATAAAAAAAAAATPRTFSQDDVDRIVQDRVAREKQKYDGFDDLKAKAARLDELEAASLTESQRLAAERDAAKAEADAAKAASTSAVEQANNTLKRAEVIAAAAKAGVAVPADAFTLLAHDAGFKQHFDKVTVGDDGLVTGAEDAITALLEARPTLVGTTPRPGSGEGGARPLAPGEKTLDEQITEASEKGDWMTVNRLNAQKLRAQQAATA